MYQPESWPYMGLKSSRGVKRKLWRMKTACKIETTAWFSPRRDFPEPGRKPTDELHRYKAREHDRMTEDLQRQWALQRPKRTGKIHKRKNTTSANNHHYVSSDRHAWTLGGSKYSDTDVGATTNFQQHWRAKCHKHLANRTLGEKRLWKAPFCLGHCTGMLLHMWRTGMRHGGWESQQSCPR